MILLLALDTLSLLTSYHGVDGGAVVALQFLLLAGLASMEAKRKPSKQTLAALLASFMLLLLILFERFSCPLALAGRPQRCPLASADLRRRCGEAVAEAVERQGQCR